MRLVKTSVDYTSFCSYNTSFVHETPKLILSNCFYDTLCLNNQVI